MYYSIEIIDSMVVFNAKLHTSTSMLVTTDPGG